MNCSRALVLTATLLVAPPLLADILPGTIGYNQWGLCPLLPPVAVAPHTVAPTTHTSNAPTHVTADDLNGYTHGVSLLTGNVLASQGDELLRADSMRYDSATGDAHAIGDVRYSSSNLLMQGPLGDYNFDNSSGVFDNAEFSLPERHGRGTAKLIKILDKDHSVLTDVHYTTCPVANQDWILNARDMELDQSTNTGIGHNVTIDFFGVPIFWTPYLNFPLNDDRKSGFLAPQLGFSTKTGWDLSAPYYFNLAPNYDATFIPRIITKRGLDLGGEFRYLTSGSKGTLDAFYLPYDALASSELLGNSERSQLNFSHNTLFESGWDFNTAYNYLSDVLYLQDFGDSLATTATTVEERHLMFTYSPDQIKAQPEINNGQGGITNLQRIPPPGEPDWKFSIQLQEFQVVDPLIPPTSYPYKLLPQMLLTWQSDPTALGVQYALNAEAVQFQQDEQIGAFRTDLKPSASYTLGSADYFFTPTAAYRFTAYDINQNVSTYDTNLMLPAGSDTQFSRATPIATLDSGLFLERDIGDGGNYLQTLEPRLFYLYVPYRDQSRIPLFDTGQPDFSFLQLFTDNRFYGADRQGDANQLSYALTSRLLNTSDGSELVEGDLGQIHYFRDRDVQLPGVAPETNTFSDIVDDIIFNLNDRWSASYGQQWNTYTRQTDVGSVGLEYHPGYHQVINISYRYNRNLVLNNSSLVLKQTDLSFAWPLTEHWRMVGRWNYDITNHLTLEDFAGFEYENCCWLFQIVQRRYITQTTALTGTATIQANRAIFLQLQLKGLATIGKRLEDFLQNGILGYSDPIQPQ